MLLFLDGYLRPTEIALIFLSFISPLKYFDENTVDEQIETTLIKMADIDERVMG